MAAVDFAPLAGLIISIGLINIWSRLNVTTKQVADPNWAPDWS